MGNKRLSWWQKLQIAVLPLWLATALVFLGGVFVLSRPLGWGWSEYLVALILAVALGAWTRHAWAMTVLERSERGIVIWLRRRNQVATDATGSSRPVILEPRHGAPEADQQLAPQEPWRRPGFLRTGLPAGARGVVACLTFVTFVAVVVVILYAALR
jgi:branched-subunit amino acid transport protein